MCHAQTRQSHQHLATSCLARHFVQTCSQAFHKSACLRTFRRPALCGRLLLCSFCTAFSAECWVKGRYRCKHFASCLARSHDCVDLLRKLLCESRLCVCCCLAVRVCHVVCLFFFALTILFTLQHKRQSILQQEKAIFSTNACES